ncbi:MAG TPA: DUF3866 family protein [Conexibacter sp.]|nr:DUF3866 family protein [Conexibacter sp.]
MLRLRRGTVTDVEAPSAWQALTVEVDGQSRDARADTALVGPCETGDEVILNVEARELALGSGGFDVVHVNLTRGLGGKGMPGAHVMKLNYTSMQHAVIPAEGRELRVPLGRPVGVFQLHGQLAPIAWALAQAWPHARVGYVQTAGGALPGGMSDTVHQLLHRGLLADHTTAGPTYGGAQEAITTAGAIHDGIAEEDWDVALVGPGPGILGSGSALGHGGIVALDSAHAALALGCPTLLAARMSSGDPRERHRGLSHHTRTVLDLLLAPVVLAVPPGARVFAEMDGIGAALDVARARGHEVVEAEIDVEGYRASGLPTRTMGRMLDEDRLFFAAALAAGGALAALIGRREEAT